MDDPGVHFETLDANIMNGMNVFRPHCPNHAVKGIPKALAGVWPLRKALARGVVSRACLCDCASAMSSKTLALPGKPPMSPGDCLKIGT